jgi:hypothetical protein
VRYIARTKTSFSHCFFARRRSEPYTFDPEYAGDGFDIRRCRVFFGPFCEVKGSWTGEDSCFVIEADELLDAIVTVRERATDVTKNTEDD